MAVKKESGDKDFIIIRLLSTKRDGMKDLLSYMEQEGFFEAPCSGSYHLACEKGLAQHTRNVMEIAENIGTSLLGKTEFNKIKDSVTIAAALHDLGKMGQFGKPNYIANTLKSGKVSDSKPYTTNKELLYVDHEIRSIAIAQMFIDLTEEEQFAILYHNGMYGNLKYALQGNETPLYLIVHTADMWASRVVEK